MDAIHTPCADPAATTHPLAPRVRTLLQACLSDDPVRQAWASNKRRLPALLASAATSGVPALVDTVLAGVEAWLKKAKEAAQSAAHAAAGSADTTERLRVAVAAAVRLLSFPATAPRCVEALLETADALMPADGTRPLLTLAVDFTAAAQRRVLEVPGHAAALARLLTHAAIYPKTFWRNELVLAVVLRAAPAPTGRVALWEALVHAAAASPPGDSHRTTNVYDASVLALLPLTVRHPHVVAALASERCCVRWQYVALLPPEQAASEARAWAQQALRVGTCSTPGVYDPGFDPDIFAHLVFKAAIDALRCDSRSRDAVGQEAMRLTMEAVEATPLKGADQDAWQWRVCVRALCALPLRCFASPEVLSHVEALLLRVVTDNVCVSDVLCLCARAGHVQWFARTLQRLRNEERGAFAVPNDVACGNVVKTMQTWFTRQPRTAAAASPVVAEARQALRTMVDTWEPAEERPGMAQAVGQTLGAHLVAADEARGVLEDVKREAPGLWATEKAEWVWAHGSADARAELVDARLASGNVDWLGRDKHLLAHAVSHAPARVVDAAVHLLQVAIYKAQGAAALEDANWQAGIRTSRTPSRTHALVHFMHDSFPVVQHLLTPALLRRATHGQQRTLCDAVVRLREAWQFMDFRGASRTRRGVPADCVTIGYAFVDIVTRCTGAAQATLSAWWTLAANAPAPNLDLVELRALVHAFGRLRDSRQAAKTLVAIAADENGKTPSETRKYALDTLVRLIVRAAPDVRAPPDVRAAPGDSAPGATTPDVPAAPDAQAQVARLLDDLIVRACSQPVVEGFDAPSPHAPPMLTPSPNAQHTPADDAVGVCEHLVRLLGQLPPVPAHAWVTAPLAALASVLTEDDSTTVRRAHPHARLVRAAVDGLLARLASAQAEPVWGVLRAVVERCVRQTAKEAAANEKGLVRVHSDDQERPASDDSDDTSFAGAFGAPAVGTRAVLPVSARARALSDLILPLVRAGGVDTDLGALRLLKGFTASDVCGTHASADTDASVAVPTAHAAVLTWLCQAAFAPPPGPNAEDVNGVPWQQQCTQRHAAAAAVLRSLCVCECGGAGGARASTGTPQTRQAKATPTPRPCATQAVACDAPSAVNTVAVAVLAAATQALQGLPPHTAQQAQDAAQQTQDALLHAWRVRHAVYVCVRRLVEDGRVSVRVGEAGLKTPWFSSQTRWTWSISPGPRLHGAVLRALATALEADPDGRFAPEMQLRIAAALGPRALLAQLHATSPDAFFNAELMTFASAAVRAAASAASARKEMQQSLLSSAAVPLRLLALEVASTVAVAPGSRATLQACLADKASAVAGKAQQYLGPDGSVFSWWC